MIRNFFLKALNKYASKWVVFVIDILLICFSFILAYSIRFDISYSFDSLTLMSQLLMVVIIAAISFLIIGSYKGIIRHTGTRDAFNVFIGVTIFSITMVL